MKILMNLKNDKHFSFVFMIASSLDASKSSISFLRNSIFFNPTCWICAQTSPTLVLNCSETKINFFDFFEIWEKFKTLGPYLRLFQESDLWSRHRRPPRTFFEEEIWRDRQKLRLDPIFLFLLVLLLHEFLTLYLLLVRVPWLVKN